MGTSLDIGSQLDMSIQEGGRVAQALQGNGSFYFDNMKFEALPDDDHWPIGRYAGEVLGSVHITPEGTYITGTIKIKSDPYSWVPDSNFTTNIGLRILGNNTNGPNSGDMYTSYFSAGMLDLVGYPMSSLAPIGQYTGPDARLWKQPSPFLSDKEEGELELRYNRTYFFYHVVRQ